MSKKQYETPEFLLYEVRLEQTIMSEVASQAPDMTEEEWTEWDD